jgi:hypothetical protein
MIFVTPQVRTQFSLIARPPEILSRNYFTSPALDRNVLNFRVFVVFGYNVNRNCNKVRVLTISAWVCLCVCILNCMFCVCLVALQ